MSVRKLPRLTLTRAVAILAALAVGYFLFAAVGDTLLSQRLNRDEASLQREIAGLERDEQRLLAIQSYLETDEYIERVARRVLGLVRPGETLVIVTSSVTPTPTPDAESGTNEVRPWWEDLSAP
jgi:cell division protein FtsB